MTEKLIDSFECYDLEQFEKALQSLAWSAKCQGYRLDEVHLDKPCMQLVERELSDGSFVMDIRFSDVPEHPTMFR